MRDSMGGVVNIVIILFFIVIVLGYLAFNVNYTKASRMKNKIIAVYEECNGKCDSECNCAGMIQEYAHDIGYSVGTTGSFKCPKRRSGEKRWSSDSYNYYCYREYDVATVGGDVVVEKTRKYYEVATKINIEVPIIQNVLNFHFFWVSGNTKIFTIKN